MYNMYNRNRMGVPVTPREPCSGTLFQLRNLNLRSIKNTDVVSSINLPNPSVTCLMLAYLDYQDWDNSVGKKINMCNQDADIIGYI